MFVYIVGGLLISNTSNLCVVDGLLLSNKTTAAVCISRRVPQGKKYYIEIFPLCIGHCCTILQVENSLEIALSVTLFEILTLFYFQQKSKMAAESGEK